jgi:hypothetical protein
MISARVAMLLDWEKIAGARADAMHAKAKAQMHGPLPAPQDLPPPAVAKAGPLPAPHPSALPALSAKREAAKAAPAAAAAAAAPEKAVNKADADAVAKGLQKSWRNKALKRTAIGAGVLAAGAGAAHLYGRGKDRNMSSEKVAMLCSEEAAKLAKEHEGVLSRADRALHKDVDVSGGVKRGLSGAKRILNTQVSGPGSKYDKDVGETLRGAKRILGTQVSGPGSKYDKDVGETLRGAKRILGTQVSGPGSKYDHTF